MKVCIIISLCILSPNKHTAYQEMTEGRTVKCSSAITITLHEVKQVIYAGFMKNAHSVTEPSYIYLF